MITKAEKRGKWLDPWTTDGRLYSWDEVCEICENEYGFDCLTPAYEVYEYFIPVHINPMSV